jgi:cell division septation protein DedD
VQVGAFRNATNARDIVAKLRHKGYQPFIRTVQDGQDRVLHRVFLDHAKEKTHAQATAKAFEETEKMEAVVMLATHLLQPDHRAAESR